MRKIPSMVQRRFVRLSVFLALAGLTLSSCHEEYYYDDYEPEWLGGSIYEFLSKDPSFSITRRLIDDLAYDEVMKLTGSKTLFVTRDSAYEAFFANNDWGVSSYDDLSYSQKKMLLNYSIINNAYLSKTMQNYYADGTLYEGLAMRRLSSLEALDTIPHLSGSQLPEGKWWDPYRNKGLYLLQDETDLPVVFFGQNFMDKYSITNHDFEVLTGGKQRNNNDLYVFDNKVLAKDTVCKNGYIHILENVLLPRKNMARYLIENPNTTIFSKLLERFAAPYPDDDNTGIYKRLNSSFTDTLYKKDYFAINGGTALTPDQVSVNNLLSYDPGWNCYQTASVYGDMGAIFAPSDLAMNDYFEHGIGNFLKIRYGSWEGIPDDVILPFIQRHMRASFIESVPSRFHNMVDNSNNALLVEESDISDTYMGVNGQVYVTNKVYPPIDFISVYSPILLSEDTKIYKWAVDVEETAADGTPFQFYKLYLNSPVSKYSVFVPLDSVMNNYLDPIAYGQSQRGMLKYWFDKVNGKDILKATLYKYDEVNNILGDSVGLINQTRSTVEAKFLSNRLWNILDSHIIVDGVEAGGDGYYITKGNDIVKVHGTGENMTIQGGRDIQKGTASHVKKLYNQTNGVTYFIDKPIGTSLNSVYSTMETSLQDTMFFNLLSGVPDTCLLKIFETQGTDQRVAFFNAYRYTVYVPTDSAVRAAYADGRLTRWETIAAMPDVPARNDSIQKLIRTLRYHFQDNAVFFGQSVEKQYMSATIKQNGGTTRWNTGRNKFYKIGVVGTANSMKLITDKNPSTNGGKEYVANVLKAPDAHNIIAKDFIFEKLPNEYKYIDGTGASTGAVFNTSRILTSASAVIHKIDNVLCFQ